MIVVAHPSSDVGRGKSDLVDCVAIERRRRLRGQRQASANLRWSATCDRPDPDSFTRRGRLSPLLEFYSI